MPSMALFAPRPGEGPGVRVDRRQAPSTLTLTLTLGFGLLQPCTRLPPAGERVCSAILNMARSPWARRWRRLALSQKRQGPREAGLGQLPMEVGESGIWSERLDSNQRPSRPERDALPSCATLRLGGRIIRKDPPCTRGCAGIPACGNAKARTRRALGVELPISDRRVGNLVGATGFEPATFSSRTRRATKLRYAPFDVAAFYRKNQPAQGVSREKRKIRALAQPVAARRVQPVGRLL